MKFQSLFTSFVSVTLATSGVLAHVSLKTPCVRYSPFCTSCPALPAGESLDYSINAPIGTHEYVSQPLCKYTTPYGTPAATWTAGQTVTVEFNPHAAIHSGGHCSFSLSYDGGKTFVVVHDELRYCFLGSKPSALVNTATTLSYSFKLPEGLPSSDKAVFAWTFINSSGNREFYMNCADVAIKGSGSSEFSGPEMLVANYGPESPLIPEFNGDYETGIDLFNSRKNITVYGGGASPLAPVSPAQSYETQVTSIVVTSTAPTPTTPPTNNGGGNNEALPPPPMTSAAPDYHAYATPGEYRAKLPYAAQRCVKYK
ncbi:hypothetical protein IW140_003798 [Coemansia sp. RSA 1813]|nr:hypothetical protein EV178_004564 [Coemansia sp. RSA 1646]KAJ1769763.1 hypothetical protein LPJ74_003788 [Coemansia sp. RSA 1843]KAJ2090115.1 hypothetical protein IW138_002925 [Coemansia sp. RSA 986]KAJ2214191.1 hypothetical protein EV179_003211 [Coemansia sp. RSA 487]KAJ2568480.1 hypothetical protein IW140_003798 [Coemansia sp. RSA 1813]